MAFRKRKEVKKQSYYVWFLGAKESKGLRGEEYIKPVLKSLLDREKELEPMKVTLQVSSKGLKIIQNVPRKGGKLGKTEQVKHFIPHHAITCAVQREDVVCAILLIYNPVTKCPVHVHAYRCDSVETAATFRSQLQILIDRPENQKKFREIETRLDAKGLLPMKRLNSDGRSTRTDDGSEDEVEEDDVSNDSDRGGLPPTRKDHITSLYDSLAAELRERLKNSKSCPILLPPKDYDTVSRSKGKLNGIQYRKSTNIKLVGVNPFPKVNPKSDSKLEASNKSTGKSSGKSSGIGSDEALSTAIQEVSSHPDFESKEIDPNTSSEEEEDWPEPEPLAEENEMIPDEWNRPPPKVTSSYKSRSKSPISKGINASLDRKKVEPSLVHTNSYDYIDGYPKKQHFLGEKGKEDLPKKRREVYDDKNYRQYEEKERPYERSKNASKTEIYKNGEVTPDSKQLASKVSREIWHYGNPNNPTVTKEYIHPITIDTCTLENKNYCYGDKKDFPKGGRENKKDLYPNEINYGINHARETSPDSRSNSYGPKERLYRRSSNAPVDKRWLREHRPVSYPNLLDPRESPPSERRHREYTQCDRMSVPYGERQSLQERLSHSPGHKRQDAGHPTLLDTNYYSRRSSSPTYKANKRCSPDNPYTSRSPPPHERHYDHRKSSPPVMEHDSRRGYSPKAGHHISRRTSSSPTDPPPSRSNQPSGFHPSRSPESERHRLPSPDRGPRRGKSPDYDMNWTRSADRRRTASPSYGTRSPIYDGVPRRRFTYDQSHRRSTSPDRPVYPPPARNPPAEYRGRPSEESSPYIDGDREERRRSAYFGLPAHPKNYRNSFAESQHHRLALHQPAQY